jgi:hypothetical protein
MSTKKDNIYKICFFSNCNLICIMSLHLLQGIYALQGACQVGSGMVYVGGQLQEVFNPPAMRTGQGTMMLASIRLVVYIFNVKKS